MKANMRTMRTIGKWAFTIAAAVVAILCAQKGNGVGVIWPIIAAILHWIATGFQELCDELVEANHENAKVIYQRWCSNRAFANFDLTRGCQTILEENGITEVHSNDYIVWKDGQATRQTLQEFRQANEEYERLNCN